MTVQIEIKDSRGRYKCITKTFKDERHLENWSLLMARKGQKVIGVFKSS